MGTRIERFFEYLQGVLLPPCCVLCAARGQPPALDLCAGCAADLPAGGARCPRCAQRLAAPPGASCAACRSSPPAFDRCVAAFDYAAPVDHLVQGLKYHARLANARVLGTLLAGAVRAQGLAAACDVVVPVPLHPERLADRGYNQAAEIARWTARELGLAVDPQALRRLRATPPQVGLGAAERRANLAGAFLASPALCGRRVAVVDDVVTSAATANAAAHAVRAAGASVVVVWAVARAER